MLFVLYHPYNLACIVSEKLEDIVCSIRALIFSNPKSFGSVSFGRFTTHKDADDTVQLLLKVVDRLRELSPLWEMHLDGVDLDTVEWQAH